MGVLWLVINKIGGCLVMDRGELFYACERAYGAVEYIECAGCSVCSVHVSGGVYMGVGLLKDSGGDILSMYGGELEVLCSYVGKFGVDGLVGVDSVDFVDGDDLVRLRYSCERELGGDRYVLLGVRVARRGLCDIDEDLLRERGLLV